jgi:hypothetical protein
LSAKPFLLRDFLNRTEAVNIYKEIVNLSKSIGYSAFDLKLSEKSDLIAQNYQIRIMMTIDAYLIQQISSIAKKHNLAVKQEKDEVIVYEPKQFIEIL